ncbi:Thiol:disulfide interchange protein DsbC precursor [compost metagenome]
MKKQLLVGVVGLSMIMGVATPVMASGESPSVAVPTAKAVEKKPFNYLDAQKAAQQKSLMWQIKNKFGEDLPIVQVAPLNGIDLVLVRLVDGSLFYTNKKADYLIANTPNQQPQVYVRKEGEKLVTNISESTLNEFNKILITGIKDSIDKKAANEKHVVYAFIDAACKYCQQLTANADAYNQQGITLKFVPYPIFGQASDIVLSKIMSYPKEQRFAKLQSSEQFFIHNKGAAIELDKMGLSDAPSDNTALVLHSREVGMALGITGTPGLVLPSGEVVSGLLSPEHLLQKLSEK